MRVLILGSGGFIGQAVAASAKSAGTYVVGATRSRPTGATAEHERVIADRAAPSTVIDVVCDKRIDVVIDVAADTAEVSNALLLKLDGAVQRYVLISSCDVYRNYGLLHRKENGAPVLDAMDESAPLAGIWGLRSSRT